MHHLSNYAVTLNIRYDAPAEIWQKIPLIYNKMPRWLGFGDDQMPYWFGQDTTTKNVYAPLPNLVGCNMAEDEWLLWFDNFKRLARLTLGFEVGDVQDGFV